MKNLKTIIALLVLLALAGAMASLFTETVFDNYKIGLAIVGGLCCVLIAAFLIGAILGILEYIKKN